MAYQSAAGLQAHRERSVLKFPKMKPGRGTGANLLPGFLNGQISLAGRVQKISAPMNGSTEQKIRPDRRCRQLALSGWAACARPFLLLEVNQRCRGGAGPSQLDPKQPPADLVLEGLERANKITEAACLTEKAVLNAGGGFFFIVYWRGSRWLRALKEKTISQCDDHSKQPK
jgi:hypothetical protein